MIIPIIAVISGLILLIWSANRFIDGASATARHFGMAPLLIGMVVIGFGTSAPEMVVSAMSAAQGNPGIAVGNAYGSNIANIALILGLTALISPIPFNSGILRKELPVLTLVTALAAWQIWDDEVSRLNAIVLITVFGGLMFWSIREGRRAGSGDALTKDVSQELKTRQCTLRQALTRLVTGLVLLVVSSRLLVYGAVEIAQNFGVSDLVIGLTVVAVGTSLPELASSIIAVRKGQHDLALGNVIGSNLFNTLAVVGIAGLIQPIAVGPEVLSRDFLVMGLLTLSLFAIGYNCKRPGRVNRVEGALLVMVFTGYMAYLVNAAF
ncbi:MAG: calcium/sodium antiporter [Dehalogenimonas sp.]|uniref:Calcium/sodium antiporter n=1 Tax=Candidatus Dehalogenimonas loeffleri TaxID=3127115 RepID=A0ABZ2J5C3_9CHLR|nr:calcium/sodium antiporter [Dehalogenimonas sp.]